MAIDYDLALTANSAEMGIKRKKNLQHYGSSWVSHNMSTVFLRLIYENTPGKIKPPRYTDVYDTSMVHYGGGRVNVVSP